MKIDAGIGNLATAASKSKDLEFQGYDGLWTAETKHDPFLPLVLAAEHTKRVELGTGIAVAFARNPMNIATLGHDLQEYTQGRLILGLGSQVRPHIEKRFSSAWSQPTVRMRELILATRAIWAAWNDRTQLDFRGDIYQHTLMTPFFDPGPNTYGTPKIYVAAVGSKMTEVAGEVGDGLLAHGFATERYLREVTLPAVMAGLGKAQRLRESFEVTSPVLVITGDTDQELESAEMSVKKQLAFYGSTPSYLPVLKLHGWEALQPELNTLSKRGLWDEMGLLITDDILDAFTIKAEPKDVAQQLLKRYDKIVDRVTFYAPYKSSPDIWVRVLEQFHNLRDGALDSTLN